ncbi:MAG: tRNA (adenosine(37)-N6)-threonylcarbamoyltransferase complex dimerization subunit type 1 TsaB [Clostridiales bacterium]
MLILGIESATPVASVALVDDKGLLGESLLNVGLTHSEQLLPMIDDLLRQCRKSFNDITAIGVSAGPGSFTGLRIGMATAKGLAQGGGLELFAIPTLEAMAYQMMGQPILVSPMQNARREQIYTGLYRWREEEIEESAADKEQAGQDLQKIFALRQRGKKERMEAGVRHHHWVLDCLIPPMASSPEAWSERLKEIGQSVCLLGDGVGMYKEIWQRDLCPLAKCLPPVLGLARGSFVALAAAERLHRGEKQDFYSMKPIYLRGI